MILLSNENEIPRFWQLSEFAGLLDQHASTVNSFFRDLETRRIHYVSRTDSPKPERVYDSLDLEVGKLKNELQKKGYKLEAIFNFLKDTPPFELRPFPDEFQNADTKMTSEIMLVEMQHALKKEIQTLLTSQYEKIKEELSADTLRIQEQSESNRLAMRQQEITDRITNNRVRLELEIEALEEWNKKDPSERTIKVGLFRREEDTTKKELFVKKFVSERIEKRLRDELS